MYVDVWKRFSTVGWKLKDVRRRMISLRYGDLETRRGTLLRKGVVNAPSLQSLIGFPCSRIPPYIPLSVSLDTHRVSYYYPRGTRSVHHWTSQHQLPVQLAPDSLTPGHISTSLNISYRNYLGVCSSWPGSVKPWTVMGRLSPQTLVVLWSVIGRWARINLEQIYDTDVYITVIRILGKLYIGILDIYIYW